MEQHVLISKLKIPCCTINYLHEGIFIFRIPCRVDICPMSKHGPDKHGHGHGHHLDTTMIIPPPFVLSKWLKGLLLCFMLVCRES
ncbi:hypothetical protein VFPPC_17404 [Pochonia chlamydosporia 170]|uniref:Uncharacterized protein n=1 Tax=Pochonia chlamydosporia 170 TaxID=1380566 RepID=A0A219ARR0_METCM|nr:hypothetical protein VFPPC_17404 [Pochonia chlamydosporia 170]OWT43447.1 hypothetical protein VFPPC_17404 [Pochonia chlamydosporia 170]